MVAIIDVAQDVRPALTRLKNAGITSIIRYDCRLVKGRWKEASNAEIKAILDHGMRVGIVNEAIGNVSSAFNETTGYDDACYSLARAAARNQAQTSAIYYAVDFDATASQIQGHVIPYFRGVTRAHRENQKVWTIGCYGSGLCNSMLLSAGLIHPHRAWITCSGGFQGSRQFVAAGREALWQYSCEKSLFGLDTDYNMSHTGDWGWWSTTDVSPPPDVEPPTAAWPSDWGPQMGKCSFYSDSTNADGTPVHNATDLSFASLHIPFGKKVKITRADTGKSVEATCHDHGPYVTGRILDVRPRVAQLLDMEEAGVVVVRLEATG